MWKAYLRARKPEKSRKNETQTKHTFFTRIDEAGVPIDSYVNIIGLVGVWLLFWFVWGGWI